MKIMFFHGRESGPHGAKYQALQEKFPDIYAPDFRGMDELEDRVAHAVDETQGEEGLLIVGSSFGGLVATVLADRHPERVAGYVLCAPALHREAAWWVSRTPDHAVIIHGRGDQVVPLRASEAFSLVHQIPLHVRDDGHRLSESGEVIVQAAAQLWVVINR